MELIRNESGDFFKLIGDIRKAKTEEVEIGWFKEQGLHNSGLTFPDLAKVHLNGVRVPKRDVLGLALFLNNPRKDPKIKSLIKKWLRKDNFTTEDLFSSLGRLERNHVRKAFGDKRLGVTSNPTPLIDTGEWKDKTVFRLRSGGRLRKV